MARTTARHRLLDTALDLFLARGYSSTTVDEICDAARVSKGSFYHAFKSKEELGLAVLDHYLRRVREQLDTGTNLSSEEPRQRAHAFLDHLVLVGGRVWASGCLMGSFALDLAQSSPTIRAAVIEKFDDVARDYAEALEPIFDGQDAAVRAREFAEQYLVVVEGGIVLAKAYADPSYVTRALERFRVDVRRAAGVAG